MLQVVFTFSPYKRDEVVSAEQLFKDNKLFAFKVVAPLHWWIDIDGKKFWFNLRQFSENERREMPLSTKVEATISLSYCDIIGICRDYIKGLYRYTNESNQWPNTREWTDFCETLLDIRGVRELVEGEI